MHKEEFFHCQFQNELKKTKINFKEQSLSISFKLNEACSIVLILRFKIRNCYQRFFLKTN